MTIALQLAQPGTDTYDPLLPMPHPIAVHDEGRCDRHHWVEEGDMLVGFQEDPDVMSVALFRADWLHGDLNVAVGMYPVFSDGRGLYVLKTAVTEVKSFTPIEEFAKALGGVSVDVSGMSQQEITDLYAQRQACIRAGEDPDDPQVFAKYVPTAEQLAELRGER